MVIFTRFASLRTTQMKYVEEYLEAGKPVVGLRTRRTASASAAASTRAWT